MKTIVQKAIGLIAIACLVLNAQAQKDCKAQLKGIYQHIEQRMEQLDKGAFFMHVTQTNTLAKDFGGDTYSTEMRLAYNGKVSHIQSDDIEVYQDAQHAISILHQERTIMVNRSTQEEFRQLILSQSSALFAEVLGDANVANCKTFKSKGQQCQKIALELSPQKQAEMKTRELIYTINLDTKELVKVEANYMPGMSQLASMSVEFHEISYAKTNIALAGEANAQVFARSGNVVPAYEGYKIIDNTKH